jgi:hypothetical protein
MAKATVKQLLAPFLSRTSYWYIPRAFWPYSKQPEGIPGFHEFIRLFSTRTRWNKRSDIKILDGLRSEGFLPSTLDEAEDYHVHYRNRINFAKKLGFVNSSKTEKPAITEVGKVFVRSNEAKWPQIFEHQLIKWQLSNPTLPEHFKSFKIFPFIFTLTVLSEVQGNYITLDECTLRLSISRSHDEKDSVVQWIKDFRNLPDREKEIVRSKIDLQRTYASRMLFLLFGFTPGLNFSDNTLSINDPDRVALVIGRAWPRLILKKYSISSWDKYFGNFTNTYWPLIPKEKTVNYRKKLHQQYQRREGSSEHAKLKRYIIENAESLFGTGTQLVQEEYYFSSGDRANLLFRLPDRTWFAIEVELNIQENDITGLLQAIKYKYMCAVQEGVDFSQVSCALIAHNIHISIKDMSSRYGVKIYEI